MLLQNTHQFVIIAAALRQLLRLLVLFECAQGIKHRILDISQLADSVYLILCLAKLMESLLCFFYTWQGFFILLQHLIHRTLNVPRQRYLGQNTVSHILISKRKNLVEYRPCILITAITAFYIRCGHKIAIHHIEMKNVFLFLIRQFLFQQLLAKCKSFLILFQLFIAHNGHRLAAYIDLTF